MAQQLCLEHSHVWWDKIRTLWIVVIIYCFWLNAFCVKSIVLRKWTFPIVLTVFTEVYQLQFQGHCCKPLENLAYLLVPVNFLHKACICGYLMSTIPSDFPWKPSCINSFRRLLSVSKASSSKYFTFWNRTLIFSLDGITQPDDFMKPKLATTSQYLGVSLCRVTAAREKTE